MSGRRIFLALALLVSAAGTGAAAEEAASLPPFKATNYPLEIRKALSYGPDECKRQGGSKVTFAPPQGVATPGDLVIEVRDATSGYLRTTINSRGRPSVCSPDGSIKGVATTCLPTGS